MSARARASPRPPDLPLLRVNGADHAPPRPIEVTPFRDITGCTDALDLVEDVLGVGAMSVVYGESGCGKTFWCSNLALHVALGWPWFGRAVEQRGVIYCALEGAHGIRNRIAAFKLAHGLHDAEVPFGIVTVTLDMLNGHDTDALIAAVQAEAAALGFRIGLVVMDTLSRAMAGGNENAPDDMGRLVQQGAKIQQATGAHLMWVHHTGKDQARGARGHSSLHAATDTEIEITAHGTDHAAKIVKQRDGETGATFPFGLRVVELAINRRGKPITSCVVTPGEPTTAQTTSSRPRLTETKQRALDILKDLIGTAGQDGHPSVPPGCPSVPDQSWRHGFYARGMAAATQDAMRKAFDRASGFLIAHHIVGLNDHRVWITSKQLERQAQ